MGPRIDLNADLGESFGAWTMGNDAAMLQIVTSANIACGFHGGDPLTMRDTVTAALAAGVAIGAHPSYLDLWGFGRRAMPNEPPDAIEAHTIYQIGALMAVAAAAGGRVTHVKPHGALSNRAAQELPVAAAIGRAIRRVDPTLVYVAMPGTALEAGAAAERLPIAREVFADRTYRADGTLTPRGEAGASIHDPDRAADQILRIVEEGAVVATDGTRVPLTADTVCVHGDNPDAVTLAERVRTRLEAAGVTVAPFAASPPV